MSDVTEPVVELRQVSVEFPGGILAVDAVDLRVAKGEFLGLMGPNGAGKSTLLAVILGLQRPTRGSARLFGAPVGPASLRRVGYVPQNPKPRYPDFPATVRETVQLGRVAKARLFQRSDGRDREVVDRILSTLEIDHLRDRRIGRLSGGETQRVFLGKALAAEPELLVLDEPTSGVDAPSRREFYSALSRLNRDLGLAIVLTSHDIHSVTKLASRIAFMSRRIFFDGVPTEFAKHPIHSDLEDFPEEGMANP